MQQAGCLQPCDAMQCMCYTMLCYAGAAAVTDKLLVLPLATQPPLLWPESSRPGEQKSLKCSPQNRPQFWPGFCQTWDRGSRLWGLRLWGWGWGWAEWGRRLTDCWHWGRLLRLWLRLRLRLWWRLWCRLWRRCGRGLLRSWLRLGDGRWCWCWCWL